MPLGRKERRDKEQPKRLADEVGIRNNQKEKRIILGGYYHEIVPSSSIIKDVL